MKKRRILFIGGSLNQTSMLHKVALELEGEYETWFSPAYADGVLGKLAEKKYLDFTILGGEFMRMTTEYLQQHNIRVDYKGECNNYDAIIISNDLIIPENVKHHPKVILVQEGMTDPENFMYHLVKALKLPRWLASTSTMGLSDCYAKFCVASEGYREHFIRKGVNPDKIVVTGIPNFDNCAQFLMNNFPHNNYVLVATSDSRETFKYENRKKFIENALRIADGRQVIFKFHPNEKPDRAFREVEKYAPGALAFHKENINAMIANCDVLVTRFSTVVYIGIALGKEVYSDFDVPTLQKMTPIQNAGTSAQNIAAVCRSVLEKIPSLPRYTALPVKRFSFSKPSIALNRITAK